MEKVKVGQYGAEYVEEYDEWVLCWMPDGDTVLCLPEHGMVKQGSEPPTEQEVQDMLSDIAEEMEEYVHNALWVEDEDRNLWIIPEDPGLPVVEAPNDELQDKIFAILREHDGKPDGLTYEVLQELGLSEVSERLRRWSFVDGLYHA
jgi:hypothetical protein